MQCVRMGINVHCLDTYIVCTYPLTDKQNTNSLKLTIVENDLKRKLHKNAKRMTDRQKLEIYELELLYNEDTEFDFLPNCVRFL